MWVIYSQLPRTLPFQINIARPIDDATHKHHKIKFSTYSPSLTK